MIVSFFCVSLHRCFFPTTTPHPQNDHPKPKHNHKKSKRFFPRLSLPPNANTTHTTPPITLIIPVSRYPETIDLFFFFQAP